VVQCGFLEDKKIYIMEDTSLLSYIEKWGGDLNHLTKLKAAAPKLRTMSLEDVKLLSPLPRPPSMRDGYAFRQHVLTARRNRGLEMIPEFDEFPVFYFTNHQAVSGPGEVWVQEKHLNKLDY